MRGVKIVIGVSIVSDEIDKAQEREQLDTKNAIARARKNAELKPGFPGDCDLCGEWSGRLVDGACAPCRDKYKLP